MARSTFLPPSDFAAAFRRHCIPKLRTMIEIRAQFVAAGLYPFEAAYADAMALASRLGAPLLPPEHLDELIDWTLTTLTEAAADAEAPSKERLNG